MNYREEEVEVVPNAWSSELPADLLGLIAEKIRSSFSLTEFIRFGCVCLEWRSFSIQNYQHIKLPDKLPVLIIPIPPSLLLLTDHLHQKKIPSLPSSSSSLDDEEVEEVIKEEEKEVVVVVVAVAEKKKKNRVLEHYYNPRGIWEGKQDAKQRYKSTRLFYSLSEKMAYHDFQLPIPYYKNIRGSGYGWLVTVEECFDDNGELYLPVSLLNPFRTDNNEIQLPPLVNGYPGATTSERIPNSYYLVKAFLSANPSSLSDPTTQLVVLGVYGHYRLAFCRPGDKTWTRLDLERYRPIVDIICYKGEFYAILHNGYVFAFVFDAAQLLPTPIVTRVFSPPPSIRVPPVRYLVESDGDLLHVWRNVVCPTPAESGRPIPIEGQGYITSQFLVFKLDPMGQWVEMKTLNNRLLFIGQNGSMSLSASDFPGCSRPNSIYYTDDFVLGYGLRSQYGPHDIGIFNLEDGSFERHYEAESKTIMPPPFWIQPML